ncbi:TetR/AcrR family transcriptional regulator [Amorphus orientalis]|uniref:AcrR family transcriptional regulator n=1 Tax=Amorphus orientalis TaxID=649198 RepID=A0AAE3VM36_9HYPH|nr:TetR/AcrR family transcriptional regulator [Amorphus orientalis]MDQ0314260.1 AcrR family transcriptional regulator [Amorphus orientalis]
MITAPATHRRSRGRPREFDIDAALDAAIPVFQARGYEGASLAQLCAAMKLTPGSVYKAFPDKRAVFLAAFDRYAGLSHAELRARLDDRLNGLERVRTVLTAYAEKAQAPEGRAGCLVTRSALDLAVCDAEMAEKIAAAMGRLEAMLRDEIRLGQTDGSIPAELDPDAAALTLLCVVQGFRVVGKTGRSRPDMMACVVQAMKTLA